MRILNSIYTVDFESILKKNIFLKGLREKRILIVGGTGLFGTYFVDFLMYLNEIYNYKVEIILTTRNIENAKLLFADYINRDYFGIIENDISFQKLECDVNIDFVIHAASNTHPLQYSNDPIGTIMTNVFGTKNILDFAVSNKAKRVLLLSSVEIYGKNIENKLIREDYLGYIDSNSLRSGYPESKRTSESLCNAYKSKYDQDFVIARLCRLYGPTVKADDSKAINQFLFKAINNEDIILKSKGNQFFSYLHVADAVTASLIILLEGVSGEAYNISDLESNITLRHLAEKIANSAGKEVKFEIPDVIEQRGYSLAVNAALCSKKLKSLRWKSFYDIDSGISNTFKSLKSFNN